MSQENIYQLRVKCIDIPNRLVTLQDRARLVVSPDSEKGNNELIHRAEIKKIVEGESFKQSIASSQQVIIDTKTQSIKLVELSLERAEMLIAVVPISA